MLQGESKASKYTDALLTTGYGPVLKQQLGFVCTGRCVTDGIILSETEELEFLSLNETKKQVKTWCERNLLFFK